MYSPNRGFFDFELYEINDKKRYLVGGDSFAINLRKNLIKGNSFLKSNEVRNLVPIKSRQRQDGECG